MQPAGRPPSPETARQIVAACGIDPLAIHYLASGAESLVWEIRTASERFTLRIASPRPGESSSYESEFAIRRRLFDLGGRVPEPIRTNRDVETGLSLDWSLDRFVDGEPGLSLPLQACRDLGTLLAKLHSLPVEGFGLLENRRDMLIGSRPDLRAGILSRLAHPWPFTGDSLEDHAIAPAAPDLVPTLRNLEPEILRVAEQPTAIAVLHSDLHAGQLLLSEGRLMALIDFGDAVAGPPGWDIASFAYFHGWELTEHLLGGYTSDTGWRRALKEEARLFTVVIALHHAGRAQPLNQPQRMEGAIHYLMANL